MAGKFVVKPSNGWYSRVDVDTGEVEDKKFRLKDTDTKDFWLPIVTSEKFNEYIKQTYQVGHSAIITDEEIEEFVTNE